MKNKAGIFSTLMGYLVAVAVALKDIDFSTFDFNRDWPTLAICVVIAIGGHMTNIKALEKRWGT